MTQRTGLIICVGAQSSSSWWSKEPGRRRLNFFKFPLISLSKQRDIKKKTQGKIRNHFLARQHFGFFCPLDPVYHPQKPQLVLLHTPPYPYWLSQLPLYCRMYATVRLLQQHAAYHLRGPTLDLRCALYWPVHLWALCYPFSSSFTGTSSLLLHET